MRIMVPLRLKSIGKRTMFVSFLSLLAGSVATVAAFAAIPDSNTGLISGCVGKLTGVVRAIDAQAGANCFPFESSISWPSATATTNQGKNALLYLTQGSTDNTQLALDTTRSHNIVSVKIVNDPNPNSTNQYLCVQTASAFTPLVAMATNLSGTGASVGGIGGPTTSTIGTPQLSSTSTDIASVITTNCGSGYSAMFNYVGGNSPAQPVGYMFFS